MPPPPRREIPGQVVVWNVLYDVYSHVRMDIGEHMPWLLHEMGHCWDPPQLISLHQECIVLNYEKFEHKKVGQKTGTALVNSAFKAAVEQADAALAGDPTRHGPSHRDASVRKVWAFEVAGRMAADLRARLDAVDIDLWFKVLAVLDAQISALDAVLLKHTQGRIELAAAWRLMYRLVGMLTSRRRPAWVPPSSAVQPYLGVTLTVQTCAP